MRFCGPSLSWFLGVTILSTFKIIPAISKPTLFFFFFLLPFPLLFKYIFLSVRFVTGFLGSSRDRGSHSRRFADLKLLLPGDLYSSLLQLLSGNSYFLPISFLICFFACGSREMPERKRKQIFSVLSLGRHQIPNWNLL